MYWQLILCPIWYSTQMLPNSFMFTKITSCLRDPSWPFMANIFPEFHCRRGIVIHILGSLGTSRRKLIWLHENIWSLLSRITVLSFRFTLLLFTMKHTTNFYGVGHYCFLLTDTSQNFVGLLSVEMLQVLNHTLIGYLCNELSDNVVQDVTQTSKQMVCYEQIARSSVISELHEASIIQWQKWVGAIIQWWSDD